MSASTPNEASAQPELGMDPIRFEVMRCAFESAADEMGGALRRAAYSTNIKDRADFSCALYDRKLRIIAQSFSQPIHLASMSRMVPRAVEIYGQDRLLEGDAIVFNDSHQGAMHLNDIAVIAPVCIGGEHVGYAAAVAHHVDIGGMSPGGLSVSTEIYQEGLIIPPTRLMAGGEIVRDVFQLIVANIRSPKQMGGDFRAQIAATLLGLRRFTEIIDRFGSDTITHFTDELISYTQRWTEREIRKLPQGTYHAEGCMDDDGISDVPVKLVVNVHVHDGRVSFDLTGSDAQRAAPINANLTYSYSALSYVVKSLIDLDIPPNAGFYAQIDVSAPAGTVVNALPPAGVVGGNEISMRLTDLGLRAMADALPEKVPACSKGVMCQMGVGGEDPRNGEYYSHYEALAGGYGGRPAKDGMDAVQAHTQNTENSSVEDTENNLPIRITRYELIPDSEGAGRFRGGLGLRRDWQFVDHEATFTVFSDNRINRPWGLAGGESGSPARYVLNPDGENQAQKSKVMLKLEKNAVFSYQTPGGGGHGPPHARDPERVLNDVLDGKVSRERARTVYGVALTEDGQAIDPAATEALRGGP